MTNTAAWKYLAHTAMQILKFTMDPEALKRGREKWWAEAGGYELGVALCHLKLEGYRY